MIWYKCVCGVLMNANTDAEKKECPCCGQIAEIIRCEASKYYPEGYIVIRQRAKK